MAHLTLGLLGSLQILSADKPVTTVESDKARALLVYLAMEADHPHRRDTLLGLLWPDCPEYAARHNLRQALFNLRQALGDHKAKSPFLLVTRSDIQFNPAADYSLDVARFNSLCQPGQATSGTARIAQLEEAVTLYRGRFLQEFFLEDSAEFEEWAVVQREGLHQRALEALTQLGDYYEEQGDFGLAHRHLARQLELDPWREEAHRQLMRVLAQQGQTSAALVQYETCRRVLAKELGIEPSAETTALYEQIRKAKSEAGKPARGPGPRPPAARALPTLLAPFIGRERELAELGRLIGNPECRLLTLMGPGGIGKTRLALQVTNLHRGAFAQGAVFIPLASVSSRELIVPATAEALGLTFPGTRDPQAQLLHYLHDKQMLLVLDNLEHLVGSAALFVDILQQAPGVKLLCTSRESLHLQSEWVYEVGGAGGPSQ